MAIELGRKSFTYYKDLFPKEKQSNILFPFGATGNWQENK